MRIISRKSSYRYWKSIVPNVAKQPWRLKEIVRIVFLALLSSASTLSGEVSAGAGRSYQEQRGVALAKANAVPEMIDVSTSKDPLIGAAVLSAQSLSSSNNPHLNAPNFNNYVIYTAPNLTKSTVRFNVPATLGADMKEKIILGSYSSSGQSVQDNIIIFERNAHTGHQAITGLASSSNLLPENSIHLPRKWRTTNEVTNIGPIKSQRNFLQTQEDVTIDGSVAAALSDYSFIRASSGLGAEKNNHSIYKSISSAKNIDFISSSRIDSERVEAIKNTLKIGNSNKTGKNAVLMVGGQTSINMVSDALKAAETDSKSFVSVTEKTMLNEGNAIEFGNYSTLKGTAIAGYSKIGLIAGDIMLPESHDLTDASVIFRELTVFNDKNLVKIHNQVRNTPGSEKTSLVSDPNHQGGDVLVGGNIEIYGKSGNVLIGKDYGRQKNIRPIAYENNVSVSKVFFQSNGNIIHLGDVSKTSGHLIAGKVGLNFSLGDKRYEKSTDGFLKHRDRPGKIKIRNSSFYSNENEVNLLKGSEHSGNVIGGLVRFDFESKYGEDEKTIQTSFENTSMSASANKINIHGSLQSNTIVYGGKIEMIARQNKKFKLTAIPGGNNKENHHSGLSVQSNYNQILIGPDAFFHGSDISIYGGYMNNQAIDAINLKSKENLSWDLFTGNTLSVDNKSVHLNRVANFEKYNFILYSELANEDKAQLNVKEIYFGKNKGVLSASDEHGKSVVKVVGIKAGKRLHVNDKFVLIKASEIMDGDIKKDPDESDLLHHRTTLNQGVSYYYRIETKMNRADKTVTAQILSANDEKSLTNADRNRIENSKLKEKIKEIENKLRYVESKGDVDEVLKSQKENFDKQVSEKENFYQTLLHSMEKAQQNKIDDLEAAITQHHVELEAVIQKGKKADSEILLLKSDLEKSNKDYSKKNAELTKINQSLQQTSEQSSFELRDLQDAKKTLERDVKAKAQLIAAKTAEVEALQQIVAGLEGDKLSLDQQLKTNQSELMAERSKTMMQSADLQGFQDTLDTLKNNHQIAIQGLQADVAQHKNALQASSQVLEQERVALSSANELLETLKKDFTDKRAELTKINQSLQQSSEQSSVKLRDLQDAKKKLENDVKAKVQLIVAKTSEVEALQQKVAGLEVDKSSLNQQLKTSQSDLASERLKATTQSADLQGLRETLDTLKNNHQIAIQGLQDDVAQYKSALQASLKAIDQKSDDLLSANNKLVVKNAELEKKTAELENVNQKLAATLDQSVVEKQSLLEAKNILTKQITEKEAVIRALTADVASLNDAVASLRADRAGLTGELAEKEGQLLTLAAELEALETQQQDLSNREDKAQTLNAELKALLKEAGEQIEMLQPVEDAAIVNPQLKALSEGSLGGLLLVTRAGDIVSDQLHTTILEQNHAPGLNLFVSTSALLNHYGNSSSIKTRDMLLMAGMSSRQPGLITAAFVEGGWSDYDTHNDFEVMSKVDGKGHQSYIGIGVYGRLENESQLGPYLEGSLRVGRLNTQFKTTDLKSPADPSIASYSLQRPYLGVHTGFGYVVPINQGTHVDFSSQYLWGQVDPQATEVVGEPIQFKSLESHRLRLSATLRQQYGTDLTLRAGVGYEYEFDSHARATTYQAHDISAPSVKGGTALLKLGASFHPVSNESLLFRLDLSAYVGQRTGARADFNLTYLF